MFWLPWIILGLLSYTASVNSNIKPEQKKVDFLFRSLELEKTCDITYTFFAVHSITLFSKQIKIQQYMQE